MSPVRLASALILSILATVPSVAQDDVFTLPDLLRTRLVVEARISPDGESIAYVLAVPRDPFVEDDGAARRELHVVGSDGRSRAFVTGDVSVRRLAWSPDGRRLAFLTKREGDEETALYSIAVDGGEARLVLSHETAVREYALTPDGERVAFLAQEPEDELREKLEKKGFKAEAYEEEQRFVRAYVAPLEPDGTAGEPRPLELDGSASMLSWSPSGDRLAVALAPTPGVDDGIMKRRVTIVRPDDASVVGRVETAGKLAALVWSPDGERIALLAGATVNDPADGRLMVADADGGAPRDVRPDWPGDAVAVQWLDDGTLLYVAHEGLETMLVRQPVEGDPDVVAGPGGPAMRSLHVSDQGRRAAVIADTPQHPREVFRWSADDDGLTRLTRSNPWLEDLRLAKQEKVRYPARDGLEIDGLLLHPLGDVPDGGAPLVLVVHGGPESHYSNGWTTRYVSPGQALAARGFAVFYPNYRGSTGRGVEFSMAGQGDYAGAEFDDLVDGVAALAERGLVDPDRVGITGGSYGGFASAWGATALSEHFAASVMFVGVSDQISKFGTTDIPNEMYEVHARKWPWEAWDFYRERSPIYHAQKHRTPLLIMHGTEDPRVHPSQSLILYRYLKTLDQAPVRLVWYPGEGHGNRKAAAQLDYAHRLARWMEHYLTGPGGEMPEFRLEGIVEKVQGDDGESDEEN